MTLDLLIIKPGAQKTLYQALSNSLSGLEPPLWAALLASFLREKGFNVDIIDAEIEPEKVIPAILEHQPKIIAIVVSGTNPSSSTMNMIGARVILEEIKKTDPNRPTTILLGLHPSALPKRTLNEEPVNMVCEGEGFSTLHQLLSGVSCRNIEGLWYKSGTSIFHNKRANLVNPDALPMAAWDLLPMNKYRAHNWHCFGHLDERSPYGVIYTSLGCPFNCSFCCINAIFGEHKIRYRNPKLIIKEIEYLVENHGVRNIKIIDEMFDLNQNHVIELCRLIIGKKYDLNIWAYARVDTVNEKKLEMMKKAGINWLGIGFESGNKNVRDVVCKGRFDNDKIYQTVRMIRNAGINIGGNFIFGLPDDTLETMQETLNLTKELNCEYTNFYVAMAYPGSRLFKDAPPESLPETWEGYSQFGYNTKPLSTGHLLPEDMLQFRDNAFIEFYSSRKYQDMIFKKFGQETLQHVKDMLKYKLERRLLLQSQIRG